MWQAANPNDRAGVTTYSPLAHFGAKAMGAACVTGVVGFGGLGHMAVKIAKAMVYHPPPKKYKCTHKHSTPIYTLHDVVSQQN